MLRKFLCNKVKNAAAYIGEITSMSGEHYGAVLREDFGTIKPSFEQVACSLHIN